MSKHTPGPWGVQNATDIFTDLGAPRADGFEAESNDGWHIADCQTNSYHNGKDGAVRQLSFDECLANARLIAAAPELLEALEIMVADFEVIDGLDDDIFDIARSAIAKARGES